MTALIQPSTRFVRPNGEDSPRKPPPSLPAIIARIGKEMRMHGERGARTATACGMRLAPCVVAWLVMAWLAGPAVAQDAAPLAVRVQVARGPYYVGESIELDVGVVGRDQRPKVEVPAIKNADVWTVNTSFKPISATGIGTSISVENLFVTRLRIIPRRAGLLEIPPIEARIDDRSGRSRQTRLSIQNPPPEGRPAEFLGGIGEFTVAAEATPASVRVGAELIYRINVSGPAAWGMTSRPDLSRFGRIAVSPRIEALPDQTVNEPPSRTFVYRIRPTRAGDVVLPPVSIAAFDPELAPLHHEDDAGDPDQGGCRRCFQCSGARLHRARSSTGPEAPPRPGLAPARLCSPFWQPCRWPF